MGKLGWRIHVEKNNDICATMWSPDGDVFTVNGFDSRKEAWMFIATYLVFLISSRSDKTIDLIREFALRTKAN